MGLLYDKLKARGAGMFKVEVSGGDAPGPADRGGRGDFGVTGDNTVGLGGWSDTGASWGSRAGGLIAGLPGAAFGAIAGGLIGGRTGSEWGDPTAGGLVGGANRGGGAMSGDPAAIDFSSIANVVGGLTSMFGGSSGSSYQNAADPFAPYRSNLAAMYAGALQPGAQTDITKMPGYSQYESGVMNPALEAAKRSGAASGMMFSGNEMQALQKTGQQGYYGFMTDYLNRLAQGSGAVNNPAPAASLGAQQANLNQQGFMQGIGALGTGLSSIYRQFGNNVAGTGYSGPTGPYDPQTNLQGGGYGAGASTGLYGDAGAVDSTYYFDNPMSLFPG